VFEGIPLDKVSTSMTINAPTSVLLAMYIVVGEKQGLNPQQLIGTVQNDILKEYVARGTYIFPPKPSLRLVADVIEYCSKNLPRFNTISISGYHMREAGCNAVQEIAFTIADGIAYVEEVLNRGLDVDKFASRLSFAVRKLWAKIMRDRFHAKNPNSLRLRFHTQTAGVTLTAQQPNVNIIRVALQALAAILGGTQSLHTCGADEALAIPTEDSVRLSLRTQQVLAYESGVTDVADPLGGSYYVEHLTSKLEEKASEYIERIDKMGGISNAIEKGFIQSEIQNNAYKDQIRIDKGNIQVVGVNTYCSDDECKIDTFKHDIDEEQKIINSLNQLKTNRNDDLVKEKLSELKKIAKTTKNIMPIMIEVVKTYATIEEICNVLREVFGEYKSSQLF
ncbi:MAG: acyl-CoA mutase large subunit family protein, partial [Promethearchaeota archaeon]